jgi:hypothetical protein
VSEQPEQRILPRTGSPADHLRRSWYLLLLVIIVAAAVLYWWRFYAFNDIGYAPRQPIPYSHKLHAGDLGIDCQYCHFNAERGRHAGVPPASVCLGCHAPDQGAAAQDREGVQQLLALMDAGAYADDADADGKSDGVLKDGGVIHWNRIHKLPDHVYFSHEWHVAAGVACQTCHGPIEEMEVVQQYASLEMGWCIECHRNDNYVGGPGYDGSAESFTVGSPSNEVLRLRVRPDDVVHFAERETKGVAGHGDAHGDAQAASADEHHGEALRSMFPESVDEGLASTGLFGYYTKQQDAKLDELFAKYADLPRWRVPDLPEAHALFYHAEADQDGDGVVDEGFLEDLGNLRTLQNAPTQCSTCHQ